MKTILFTLLFSAFVLVGCNNSSNNTVNQGENQSPLKVEQKVTLVVNGVTYTLVRPEKKLANGIIEPALYEKEGNTTYYYTPSVTGRDMVSVLR